jgi:hypothetical protein
MLAESANEAGWHGAEAGAINEKFLKAGASFAEYKAAPRTAVERGLIALHPSSSHDVHPGPAAMLQMRQAADPYSHRTGRNRF